MARGISGFKFQLLFWLILLFGVALRLPHLNGALEYDEIWTLENYAGAPLSEIFSNISLPNNHPLNSLWVKFTFVNGAPFLIRLASFFSGIGAIVLAGLAARQLFADRRAMLLAMLFCAVAPGLVAYSQTARGYSGQIFLILAFANLILSIGKWRAQIVMPLLLISGFSAVVALPTSVLYLLPLSVAGLYLISVLDDHRQRLIYLAGMALFAAGAGSWYFIQMENLREAQTWSIAINSAGDCIRWLLSTLTVTGAILLPVALLLAPHDRTVRWLAILAALPLLAAVWTNAGPPRAYLMLTVYAAVAAAGAVVACRNWRRWILLACAILIMTGGNLSGWHYTDWHKIYRRITELPPNVMVVANANDCYPLKWNNPGILNNIGQRIKAPEILLVLNESQTIEGVNRSGETVTYPINSPSETVMVHDIQCSAYLLTPVADGEIAPDKLCLIIVYGVPENTFTKIVDVLMLDENLIKINPWLVFRTERNNTVFRYVTALVKTDEKTPELLRKLTQSWPNYVKAYRIGL